MGERRRPSSPCARPCVGGRPGQEPVRPSRAARRATTHRQLRQGLRKCDNAARSSATRTGQLRQGSVPTSASSSGIYTQIRAAERCSEGRPNENLASPSKEDRGSPRSARRFAMADVIPNSSSARRGVTSYTLAAGGIALRAAIQRSTESSDTVESPWSLAFIPIEDSMLG